MQTIPLVFLFLGGMAGLYWGAELLVIASSRIALASGLTPLVVGLTVVAFMTSTPELAGSLAALWNENSESMALGNIIGSNIANIGLILSVILMIHPLEIQKRIRSFEVPFIFFSTLLVFGAMFFGSFHRFFGVLLLGLNFAYVYGHLKKKGSFLSDRKKRENFGPAKGWYYAFLLVTGVVFLSFGAAWLVRGAVVTARMFGISERVIGLTVVALGTSLPELAASFLAVFRRLPDVALGNIIGSNVFNLLFILGVVILIRPLSFAPVFLSRDMPVLLAFTTVLGLLCRQKVMGRGSGLLLFIGYVVYLFFLF